MRALNKSQNVCVCGKLLWLADTINSLHLINFLFLFLLQRRKKAHEKNKVLAYENAGLDTDNVGMGVVYKPKTASSSKSASSTKSTSTTEL